jgi:hypothetical protein
LLFICLHCNQKTNYRHRLDYVRKPLECLLFISVSPVLIPLKASSHSILWSPFECPRPLSFSRGDGCYAADICIFYFGNNIRKERKFGSQTTPASPYVRCFFPKKRGRMMMNKTASLFLSLSHWLGNILQGTTLEET